MASGETEQGLQKIYDKGYKHGMACVIGDNRNRSELPLPCDKHHTPPDPPGLREEVL